MMFLSVACALCVLYSDGADANDVMPPLLLQSGADGFAWEAAAELLARALQAAGGAARAAPRPPCPAPPDSPLCLRGALAVLRRGAGGGGEARVALALPVGAGAAGPLARRLRDAGLADLGDAAPPVRRICLQLPAPGPAATPAAPALHSLEQLLDPAIAAAFALPSATLHELVQDASKDSSETGFWCGAEDGCVNGTYTPEWCGGSGGADGVCADVLVGAAHELRVLRGVLRAGRLRARLTALGPRLAGAAPPGALLCGWHADLPPGRALRPPPCADPADLTELDAECPFEARRLVKVAPEAALARSARVARVLDRFWLEESELRALGADAARMGAAAAAAYWQRRLAARWRPGAAQQLRVAALVPARVAPGGLAVAAAAAFAEETLETEAPIKVQVSEAGCSSARAFRVATDALGGGEYGTLSALAGGACAGDAGDALCAAFRLPALAYEAAAPAPGGWRLLAAGEARAVALAAAALLRRLRWRRVAVLAQPARLDAAALSADTDVLLHVQLPERADAHLIDQWASRAAAVDARILLLAVEDARVLQAALCAGGRAGLRPAAGVVWLLLAPPAAVGSLAECARAAADHSLAVQWQWAAAAAAAVAGAGPAWPAAWRAGVARHCARLGGDPGGASCAPDARAALLYDVLQLWARSLHRLRADLPAAVDDLHDPNVTRKLIEFATTMNYTGLTGPFEWGPAGEEAGGATLGPSLGATRVRRGTLLVTQWRGGREHAVAHWGPDGGDLHALREPRWLTADGRAPGDGAACPLGALLGSCAAALLAAAALALAALLAALAGAALYGKRRLERRFRERLAALARAPPHAAPDRWELPRPHVVINRRLGGGAFGAVYGGHARLGDRWTAVAVKMLRPGASTDEKLDFLAEVEAMKRLEHPNVVRLLGVVTQSEPVCCVMEFLLYGDLKGYLLARRQLAADGDPQVAPPRLTALARDAARALSYLAARRVLHRDVAARNCLVSARGSLKLADFGMSRCLFEREYYRFGRRGLLPVRWMSPEALAHGVFSPASDVWALAVLLLEIVTFGALPYAGLSNRQVLARVVAGGAPDLPAGIQPPLAGLLKACWARAAAARPAAAEVAAWLAEGERLLTPCLPEPAPPPPGERGGAEDGAGWWSTGSGGSGSGGTDSTYLSDTLPHAPLLP